MEGVDVLSGYNRYGSFGELVALAECLCLLVRPFARLKVYSGCSAVV